MELKLSYGNQEIFLDVPENNLLGILQLKPPANRPDIDVNGLNQSLKEFLSNCQSVLIIVNDYTRPTPNEKILSMIEPVISNYNFRLIVACGSHRAPTADEFVQIFGKYYDKFRDKILVHDAKDKTRLKFLGKTRRNTPVWLNQAIWEAEKLIVINSVEPHYFAGFTGGRKSFLPGVAGLDTITANHKLALSPDAKTLCLTGNPVHEDMSEIAKMVPRPIFSIQIVIDNAHQIYSLYYGDIFCSFDQAVQDAKSVFCVPIKQKAEIVIALVQEPYDINFYQSEKAIENAKLALKENGIMIVASKCRKGVGDDEFVRLLASTKSPKQTLEKIEKEFVLGYHKSAKLAEILLWAEIWTVMPISDEIIKSVFMRPFNDINVALKTALEKKGRDAKIFILPDASLTVPLLI
ncbi:MAG: nickel-dependent lactate racemase [candidate division WOR-3 bacterium]|nr:nickel-dependent lactate racemase [candidate division WOR-3 bacterium]